VHPFAGVRWRWHGVAETEEVIMVEGYSRAPRFSGKVVWTPETGWSDNIAAGPDAEDLAWARDDLGPDATDAEVLTVAERRAGERAREAVGK
jgi:hypothetical protein